jgi:hypothetical protein
MPFHHFPSEFVYWQQVEKHEHFKQELLPKILEENAKTVNNPFKYCNFNTSYYVDPETNMENNTILRDEELINHIVVDPIDNMIREYNDLGIHKINQSDLIIFSGWWNVYNKGDFQEEHSHMALPIKVDDRMYFPYLSVVYVLNDESKESSLVFTKDSPIPFKRLLEPHSFNTYEETSIKEGVVMIFPCNLKHRVRPVVNDSRVTIAYNIFANFETNHDLTTI